MSFFCDLINEFNIENLDCKTMISLILGVGIGIVGKIKIINLEENEISILSYKQKIIISGKDLVVKSVAKGELIISGEIIKVETCEGL